MSTVADPSGATMNFGETAVIDLPLAMENDLAGWEPKSTEVTFENEVPVIVTDVPPPAGPLCTESAVIVGIAA